MEKTTLDVELATAAKLKPSILAALSKRTTLCKTITGGDAGLVVCTKMLERGRRELLPIHLDNNA